MGDDTTAKGRFIRFVGWLREDGVFRLDPGWETPKITEPPRPNCDYSLELLDAQNQGIDAAGMAIVKLLKGAHIFLKKPNRKAVAEHVRVEFDSRDFNQALQRPLPIPRSPRRAAREARASTRRHRQGGRPPRRL